MTTEELSAAVIKVLSMIKKLRRAGRCQTNTKYVELYRYSMDESVRKSVFEKLGAEHLTHPGFKKFIHDAKKNLQGYFDNINSNKDTYWEKIEYLPATSTIKITGKPGNRSRVPMLNQKIRRYHFVTIAA